MLYALLCYNSEEAVVSWSKEEDAAVMAKLAAVNDRLAREKKLGPVARLMQTTAATTLRKSGKNRGLEAGDEAPLVLDGPFAETKEQLLGFFVVDCANLEEALAIARELGAANPGGAYEIRPIALSCPARRRRSPPEVTDAAWIDLALRSARPRAVGALLRYFGDLDTAEEAFQEACLAALSKWPENGPPRDVAAWLIFVGRNAALDGVRRRSKERPLPPEEALSDTRRHGGRAGRAARRRPLPRRHPAPAVRLLPSRAAVDAADRAGAARGLRADGQGDRARLPGRRDRDGAADHARQGAHRRRRRFRSRRPAPDERAARLRTVAAMIYLVFNEGYSATGGEAQRRAPLCGEAIRLARLLLRLFPDEPEIMGLLALLLLQHARAEARLDADGAIVLLEDQDRGALGSPGDRRGGRAARQGDAPPPSRPLPGAGGDRGAARSRAHRRRDRLGGDRHAVRDAGTADAVAGGDAEPRGRGRQAARPGGGAGADRAARAEAFRLLSFLRRARARCWPQLGRSDEARAAFDRAIALANTAVEAAHIRMHLDRLARGA